MSNRSWPYRLAVVAMFSAVSSLSAASGHRAADEVRLPDHYEFDASLAASFTANAQGQFPIRLKFDYPAGGAETLAAWQIDVLSPKGTVVQRWIGESA
ncbi:MAG: hypothetical protein WC213_12115, partial [Arenimonas sp.]